MSVLAGIVFFSLGDSAEENAGNTQERGAITVKEQGTLSKGGPIRPGWVGEADTHWKEVVLAGDTLVALECDDPQNQDSCVLRGRDSADGQVRWTGDFLPGPSLIALEGTVLSYGLSEMEVGSSTAHMTLVNAADGSVLRKMPDGSLVARSNETLAFVEDNPAAGPDFDAPHEFLVGVRINDGQEVWRQPHEREGRITIISDIELPSGFDTDATLRLPAQYLLTSEGDDDVVRAVDTGDEVARMYSFGEKTPIGVYGDKLITTPVVPGESTQFDELSAYNLTDLNNPLWIAKRAGAPTACGTYLCTYGEKSGGKLIELEHGKVVAENPDGPIMFRQEGSTGLIQHCDVKKAILIANPCPAHRTKTQITNTAAIEDPMWQGGGLVFATTAGQGDTSMLVVGIADPTREQVRIIVAGPNLTTPTEVGIVPRAGFGTPPVSDEMKVIDLYLFFNLRCAATPESLYCGTRLSASTPESWDYEI